MYNYIMSEPTERAFEHPEIPIPPSSKVEIIKTFNKTLKEFTDEISFTFPEFKTPIYRNYHHIREEDTQFLEWFERESKPYYLDIATKNEKIFTELNTDVFLIPDVNFCFMFRSKISANTKDALWKYLHTMLLLVSHYQMNSADIGSTFEEWSKMLDEENVDSEKLQEMQEQAEKMIKLMETLTENLRGPEEEEEGADEEEGESTAAESSEKLEKELEDDPFIKKITKSKIAKLAEELAQEIKIDDLGLNGDNASFTDVFGLLGRNPQKILNLVKTVGNKIQNKLKDGDIKQDELVAEAQDIMSSMQQSRAFKKMFKKAKKGGMPDPTALFSQLTKQMGMGDIKSGDLESMFKQYGNMMGAAGAGGLGANLNKASTQDRLRKKMESKRKVAEEQGAPSELNMDELNAQSERMMNELLMEEDGTASPAAATVAAKKKKKKKPPTGGNL